MSKLDIAIKQIKAARSYAEVLIDSIDPADWFRRPSDGNTHVAWQVGHLAIAQYRLALERVRGEQPGDDKLIPANYLSKFGKGSVPQADPTGYPKPQEIRHVYDRVHQQTLEELGNLREDILEQPTDQPHPMFDTKFGALQWCAQHEFLHAGQIGLLRRLFGQAPLR